MDVKSSIYNLMIVNKAGGLIYNKDFSNVPKQQSNDYLRLASTFHSLHAISGRGFSFASTGGSTSPPDWTATAPPAGMISLDAKDFRLQCYQTLTGIKFLMTGAPTFGGMDRLLHNIYLLYTDFVLKNPFYEADQPIRCELFDLNLMRLISGVK